MGAADGDENHSAPPKRNKKRTEVAETTYRLKNSGGSLVTKRSHPVHGLCEGVNVNRLMWPPRMKTAYRPDSADARTLPARATLGQTTVLTAADFRGRLTSCLCR